MLHVVACFLRHEGRVLLLCRAHEPHAGRWDAVSRGARQDSGASLSLARAAADDAVAGDPTLACAGESFAVARVDRSLTVHPYLFDCGGEATVDGEWVHPPALRERETVPWLGDAYDRVAPDLATVREDRDHGSAWVATRALEVLRDRAAATDDRADVAAVACALRDARPAMCAVANRVNHAMAGAETPADVRAAAAAGIDASARAGRAAASEAAALLSGPVATCSRSRTAVDALDEADTPCVVGESRVGREGVAAAEALGGRATLVPDAAIPGAVAGLAGRPTAESVLVGADAVLPDGSVVNRTGTYPLALAAAEAGAPVRVVAARDKVCPASHDPPDEREPAAELYDGDAPVGTATPLFERVPAALVDAVVTEDGPLDADGVGAVAADHRRAAAWDEA